MDCFVADSGSKSDFVNFGSIAKIIIAYLVTNSIIGWIITILENLNSNLFVPTRRVVISATFVITTTAVTIMTFIGIAFTIIVVAWVVDSVKTSIIIGRISVARVASLAFTTSYIVAKQTCSNYFTFNSAYCSVYC